MTSVGSSRNMRGSPLTFIVDEGKRS
jgi:hypothetical protein